MTELGHIQKLTILLEENKRNVERSKQACDDAGINTDVTMGEAIRMFVHGNDLHDVSGERNEFHDAMHIAAQAPPNAHGEAVAAIFEHTLLREPYNGDINKKLAEAARQTTPIRQIITGSRRFNPSGHEDFEKPAPAGSLEEAKILAQERLDVTSKSPDQTLTDTEAYEIYERAVETDEFFKNLMGGRAPYQLHLKELMDTPLSFFGLEQVGAEELILQAIPSETRAEILDNLGDQNTTMHLINSAKTEAELARVYQPEHPQAPEGLDL